MQFKVPQFLDIEDKIFGPLTFSQFAWLAGGAGLIFVLHRLLGLFLGFIPMAMVAIFSLALSFYKPNDKPFVNMVEAGLRYVSQNKLYIWQRKINKVKKEEVNLVKKEEVISYKDPRLNASKLKDLAWSLDVLDLKK